MRKSRKRVSRKRVSRKRVSRKRTQRKSRARTSNVRISRRKKQYRIERGSSSSSNSDPMAYLGKPQFVPNQLWEHDYTAPASAHFQRRTGNVRPHLPIELRRKLQDEVNILNLHELIDKFSVVMLPQKISEIGEKIFFRWASFSPWRAAGLLHVVPISIPNSQFFEILLNAKTIYCYESGITDNTGWPLEITKLQFIINEEIYFEVYRRYGWPVESYIPENMLNNIWDKILVNYLYLFENLEKLQLDSQFPRDWPFMDAHVEINHPTFFTLKYAPPKLKYLMVPSLRRPYTRPWVLPEFCRNVEVLEITTGFGGGIGGLGLLYIKELKIYSNIKTLILHFVLFEEDDDDDVELFKSEYEQELLLIKIKFPNLQKLILIKDEYIDSDNSPSGYPGEHIERTYPRFGKNYSLGKNKFEIDYTTSENKREFSYEWFNPALRAIDKKDMLDFYYPCF